MRWARVPLNFPCPFFQGVSCTRRSSAALMLKSSSCSSFDVKKSSMVSDPDLRLATEQGALLGNPGEIIEQLHALQADGIEYVLLSGTNREAIRRFARDIMPAFS